MKRTFSAAELKQLALRREMPPCEMRSFSAKHEGTLSSVNHIPFVEAFLLQLGDETQHTRVLELLSTCERDFRGGKIAYTPPCSTQLTSSRA